MTMELGGTVTIECKKSHLRAELEFKLKVAVATAPPATGRASEAWGSGCRGVKPWGPSPPLFVPQRWFPEQVHLGEQLLASLVQPGPRQGEGPPTGHTAEGVVGLAGGPCTPELKLRHW